MANLKCISICNIPFCVDTHENFKCPNPYLDPVTKRRKLDKICKTPKLARIPKWTARIEPSLDVRGAYTQPYNPDDVSEIPKPKPKICEIKKLIRVPSPVCTSINHCIARFDSPRAIGPVVKPRRPSDTSMPWTEYPAPPSDTKLQLKKPKSGIVIRDSVGTTLLDQLSIGYDRPFAVDYIKKYGLFDFLSLGLETEDGMDQETLNNIIHCIEEQAEDADNVDIEIELERPSKEGSFGTASVCREDEDDKSECVVTCVKSIRDNEDLDSEPPEMITKWAQKLRTDSDYKRKDEQKVLYKRRTFQSHSFTNIKFSNRVVKEYKYGITLGSYDQSDGHFSGRSQNKQTLANLICAYCFSFLKHPCEWNCQDIDDVLESGDKLYQTTIDALHLHHPEQPLKATDLVTRCIVEKKKFLFQISEPLLVGLTKSDDRRVYNLHKGLTIFFNKYSCALIESQGLQLIIWKCRFYYMFDPKARAKDLYSDSNGAAAIMNFFDIKTIVSMLVERTVLKNCPFTLSRVCVTKILDPTAPNNTGDSLTSLSEDYEYRIINDETAVLNGSFSMADPCFEWTKNKQALPMCVIALVYSNITPPSAWNRSIIDKILNLGNQFYYEIATITDVDEIQLQNLPATFTLGPNRITISILDSIVKGYMFARKKYPNIEQGIETFFEDSTSGILMFDKFCYGIWKNREFYYLFDPFPRDYAGYFKENGTALLSMHGTMESLMKTLMMNVNMENNCLFSIHGLKDVGICVGGDELRPPELENTKEYLKDKLTLAQIKPVCVDPKIMAMVAFMPNTKPSGSCISVGSSVVSLAAEFVPVLLHHGHPMPNAQPVSKCSKESLGIVDLDSPSLSDTQIEPPRPQIGDYVMSPIANEVYSMTSLLDVLVSPEDGYEGDIYIEMHEFEKKMLEDLEMWYEDEGFGEFEDNWFDTTICRASRPIQTVTEGYRCLKKQIWRHPRPPPNPYSAPIKKCHPIPLKYPAVTLSEELLKDTNFIPMPDGSEIICGTTWVGVIGNKSLSLMTPFLAIMAIVVAKKYSMTSWDSTVLDFIITSGNILHDTSEQRFDEAAVHEFRRIGLGSTDFTAKSTYILDSVYKPETMEQIFNTLFKRCSSAVIINPYYSCAIFYKNFLYYLFDPYNSNPVGLGLGDKNKGTCCFIRFTNLHQLVARIIYNKSKREEQTGYQTTRYVLSVVDVHWIRQSEDKDNTIEPPPEPVPDSKEQRQPQAIGYQRSNGQCAIYGTERLRGRKKIYKDKIKECHFVSLSALLLLTLHPIDTWDYRLVDQALTLGQSIYSHAKHKKYYQKRVINNILLENKFYDLVIQLLEYPMIIQYNNLWDVFGYYLRRRNFLMIQFPSICMALYVDGNVYHLFDAYKWKQENARWIQFTSRLKCVRYIEKTVPCFGLATYYTFCVTSIRNAPKTCVFTSQMNQYKPNKATKIRDIIDVRKPFIEIPEWVDIDSLPWSRLECRNVCGQPRGVPETMWKDWDIEIPNDLWSLWGNLHQKSKCFHLEARGKQTLCNCIMCCVATRIYEFSEWNPILLDSILKDGNQFYVLSVRALSQKDDEFNVEHLLPQGSFPPFSFDVAVCSVVAGSLYLVAPLEFNLSKAMLLFFDNRERRLGLIVNANKDGKKILAFGKTGSQEYFIYDCQSYGAPLFLQKQGCSYILKMTSLNRLIHSMTLILCDGDFFIYDVEITNLKDTRG